MNECIWGPLFPPLKIKKKKKFWPGGACEILVLQPKPPALEAQSLHHWTAREVHHEDHFEKMMLSIISFSRDLGYGLLQSTGLQRVGYN